MISGNRETVNPEQTGTKASALYQFTVDAGQTATIRLRLSDRTPAQMNEPFGRQFAELFEDRQSEADAFYRSIAPDGVNPDKAGIVRQALAGMLWSKQYFDFDVSKWLDEHGADATCGIPGRCGTANGSTW